jgi:hypothetical protein
MYTLIVILVLLLLAWLFSVWIGNRPGIGPSPGPASPIRGTLKLLAFLAAFGFGAGSYSWLRSVALTHWARSVNKWTDDAHYKHNHAEAGSPPGAPASSLVDHVAPPPPPPEW